MKKPIVMLASFFAIGLCHAKTEYGSADSLSFIYADSGYTKDQIDSSLIVCDSIPEVTTETVEIQNGKTKHKNDKAKKRIVNHASKQYKKRAGWFDDAIDAIGSALEWLTSPVRPVWGNYQEAGQNTSAPLALFRRSTFAQDKGAIIAQIQDPNLNDFKSIYTLIYTTVLANPGGWGAYRGQAPNAAYAKFGAFVLLMGVNSTGAPLSSTDSTFIANNVYSILNSCFSNTPNDWFEGGDWWQSFGLDFSWIDWDDVHQYRSKDLINYCCAHDLMRTAGYHDLETGRKQIKKYATELYWQATDNFSSMSNIINNNLVLMTASALAAAAMVCNMETDYLWFPWRYPNRWVNKSFARINQTMFTSWTHTESERGGIYGYREGPGYYDYAMENLMPMFVMFNNYVNENESFSALYPENHLLSSLNIVSGLNGLGTLGLANLINTERVKNFLHDPDWENTWIWYTDQVRSNGAAVPYDDTKVNSSVPLLACTKKQQFSLIAGDKLLKLLENDKPDFLAANNPSRPSVSKVNRYRNRGNIESGDITFRTPLSDNDIDQHYLHALAEPYPGFLEKLRLNFGSKYVHEHADALSFTISAGDELLAMDPPYMGYEYRGEVNRGHVHNLITIDGNGPDLTDFPEVSDYNADTKSVKMYNRYSGALVTRKIKVHYEEGSSAPYYEIIDMASDDSSSHTYRFNLNGNGTKASGSCDDSKLQTDGYVVWDYPCTKGRHWGLYAKVTGKALSGGSTVYSLTDNHKHGDESFSSNTSLGNILSDDVLHSADDFKYSYHSRLEAAQTGHVALYQTIIKPMTCAEISAMGTPAEKGKVTSSIDTSRTVTVVDSIGDENRKNIHVARTTNSYVLTINNPKLESGSGPFPDMELQAEHGFLSFAPDSVFENGGCKAYTKFRAAAIDAGKLLKYDDTIYISSNQFVDTKFSIEGKWKYTGYCKTSGSAATVSYFLPDLAQGILMTVAGTYSSFTYDTTTFIMSVTFAANTTSKFRFTLVDPCQLSCYYPDTSEHITGTFTQIQRVEPLAHKLKILQPSGYLHMTKSAVMNICENNWLCNRDSLILEDLPNDEPNSLPLKCTSNPLSQRTSDPDHMRTSIIVNNKATLVLDSGSYTRIGANSSIYVLPGGSLIIKPYAVVEIGSEDVGHGEILADENANVCVSSGADIRFYRNDMDSSDKNIFFVILNNQTNPNTIAKTKADINNNIFQMLVDDTLIESGHTCQPFCDYKSIIPPYGIGNRDWGYAPFVTPRAAFKVSGDTLCPGDSVVLDFRKVLNEEGYHFKICRVQDTLSTTNCILGDTNMIEEDHIIPSDVCIERTPAPDFYKFRLWDSGWYKIHMNVINECGETHDSIRFVYVPAPPDIVIDIPDSICPGVGNLIADGSATQSHRTRSIYRWSIQLAVPDSIRLQDGGIDYGGDWGEYDSTSVGNSFNFPDFRFIGGFKYAVGLSVKGWCGWVTKWDTVDVPLGVMIRTKLASNYQNPVGPSAFELKGYITGATSYSWDPTTYLDEPDSLTTIARPDQPIDYILTVTDGLCYDSDTISVSHNDIAYAGADNLLCMGKGVVLGTDYNSFSLLSIMHYLNDYAISNQFDIYETTLDIPKYFTHFMMRDYNSYSNSVTNMFKDDTLLRRYLMEMPEYAASFKKFNLTNQAMDALTDMHNAISSDGWLNSYLSTNGYAISDQECEDMFDAFNTWYDPGNFFEITWEHKLPSDTAWTANSSWTDHFNRPLFDSISKTHRITVNDNLNSHLEYDEVRINRDTVIIIGFNPILLSDSTVFFSNISTPVNTLTKYYWNFGDGGTATLKMPIHTFVSMDSTYIVCLTAINECDSFTHCDTLTLDTNGVTFTLGKRGNDHTQPEVLADEKAQLVKQLRAENKLSLNRPNPFSDKTIIEYELKDGYKDAEIRITNTLGQVLKVLKLKGVRGYTLVDGSQWKDGMYFYSLVLDGVVISSKTMIVER